jgi:hypothetical protein
MFHPFTANYQKKGRLESSRSGPFLLALTPAFQFFNFVLVADRW